MIEDGGRFAVACAAFLADHPAALYHDRTGEDDEARKTRQKKAASKTKFTCPECGANAWGKPDLHLICGDCQTDMEADAPGDDDPATDAPSAGLRGEFGKTHSNAIIGTGARAQSRGVASNAAPSDPAPGLD